MNVQINVDMTPEEMRRLMGLPDVSDFNKEIMAHMSKRIQDGIDDPVSFFRSSVMGNSDAFRNWMNLFTMGGSKAAE